MNDVLEPDGRNVPAAVDNPITEAEIAGFMAQLNDEPLFTVYGNTLKAKDVLICLDTIDAVERSPHSGFAVVHSSGCTVRTSIPYEEFVSAYLGAGDRPLPAGVPHFANTNN